MLLDLWLHGGPIIQQLGERVIYDAGSLQDARLADFIGLDGEWRWPRVSMDLMDIWDRIQRVRSCPSVKDRWVWLPGSHDGYSITSAWDTIRPHRIGLVGRVYCGVREIFLSIHFMLGWLSGID